MDIGFSYLSKMQLLLSRQRYKRLVLLAITLFSAGTCYGLDIQVMQKDGSAAASVVVSLVNAETKSGKIKMAEMSQRDRRFDPHILVVQKGATVSFPNYDDIKHHVYSFSSVKAFEQELYKGTESTPVTFEQTGIVELGCNVHDWMLAYIYIVDTPYFGKTDEQGKLVLPDVPKGNYQITVWHPGLDIDDNTQMFSMDIAETLILQLSAQLEEEDELEVDTEFDDY